MSSAPPFCGLSAGGVSSGLHRRPSWTNFVRPSSASASLSVRSIGNARAHIPVKVDQITHHHNHNHRDARDRAGREGAPVRAGGRAARPICTRSVSLDTFADSVVIARVRRARVDAALLVRPHLLISALRARDEGRPALADEAVAVHWAQSAMPSIGSSHLMHLLPFSLSSLGAYPLPHALAFSTHALSLRYFFCSLSLGTSCTWRFLPQHLSAPTRRTPRSSRLLYTSYCQQ